jgi:hypothetical protein
LNEAKGTHGCYLGAGVFKPTFTVQLSHNFVGTNPYANGFTDFPELNIPSRGVLTSPITLEMKQASGSDPVPVMLSSGPGSGPFPGTPTTVKQGTVPDVFYVTGSQASTLTQRVNADGTIAAGGAVTYSFGLDATGMATSADQTTVTIKLYTYFSLTYFTTTFGAFNSEAVTQMSTYTLTLQTH